VWRSSATVEKKEEEKCKKGRGASPRFIPLAGKRRGRREKGKGVHGQNLLSEERGE